MVRKDGAFVKAGRISDIKRLIAKNFPNPVPVEKVLVWAEVNLGLKRETARHYLDLVLEAQGWVEVDGEIITEVSVSGN